MEPARVTIIYNNGTTFTRPYGHCFTHDRVKMYLGVARDTKTLSLDVLAATGFRRWTCTKQFKQYMLDMLDNETTLLSQGELGTGTLMTSFVRALNGDHKDTDIMGTNEKPSQGTISEVLDNIFVINFAGHDTTANTLAFAMLMLATHP